MKKTTILLLCLFVGASAFSQLKFTNWRFGQSAGADFNPTPPVGTQGALSAMFALEGSAAVSDNSGGLLFYTHGRTVYNKSHNIMSNGDSLEGADAATQNSLILNIPGSAGKYYLFTLKEQANSTGIYYHEIDMALAGGQGAVVTGKKNQLLLGGVFTEKMTATRHCNGTDYWLAVHEWGNNRFAVFRVSAAGVSAPIYYFLGSPISVDPRAAKGYMKFSPDGHRLAVAHYNLIGSKVEMFNFNPSTGFLSNSVAFPAYDASYGVAFSPDNSKFYVSSGKDTTGGNIVNRIVQFDMTSKNPVFSGTIITQRVEVARRFGALQLGPNGKIYLAQQFLDKIHAINNPNLRGAASAYQDSAIFLPNSTCRLGLPNCVDNDYNIKLKSNFRYTSVCIGTQMDFRDSSLTNAVTYSWDFGDPASGANNTSTAANPSHMFTAAGTFQVKYRMTNACGEFDTISKYIVIGTSLPVSLGPDTVTICTGTSTTLTASATSVSYKWYQGVPNAWNIMAQISQSISVSIQNWYKVEVDNGFCKGADSVFVRVNTSPPTFTMPATAKICQDSLLFLDAGNAGSTYLWSNGQTTQKISVNKSGTYKVVVNKLTCIDSAKTVVTIDSIPNFSLGRDTVICVEDNNTITLKGPNGTGLNYVWSTTETSKNIVVKDHGTYTLWVSTAIGCTSSDSIVISKKCPSKFFVPTAFTPNDDNLNDRFLILTEGISDYKIAIYTRWGQPVYESTDPTVGWDGNHNGKPVKAGRYFFRASFYQDDIKSFQIRNGVLELVR